MIIEKQYGQLQERQSSSCVSNEGIYYLQHHSFDYFLCHHFRYLFSPGAQLAQIVQYTLSQTAVPGMLKATSCLTIRMSFFLPRLAAKISMSAFKPVLRANLDTPTDSQTLRQVLLRISVLSVLSLWILLELLRPPCRMKAQPREGQRMEQVRA